MARRPEGRVCSSPSGSWAANLACPGGRRSPTPGEVWPCARSRVGRPSPSGRRSRLLARDGQRLACRTITPHALTRGLLVRLAQAIRDTQAWVIVCRNAAGQGRTFHKLPPVGEQGRIAKTQDEGGSLLPRLLSRATHPARLIYAGQGGHCYVYVYPNQ